MISTMPPALDTSNNAESGHRQFGTVIGLISGIADPGKVRVLLDGRRHAWARTLIDIEEQHIGLEAALQFEGGDPDRPLIIGIVRGAVAIEQASAATVVRSQGLPLQALLDEEEIVLIAKRKIVLKCGAASISLDADGNIEIRGKHVLSRAAGQNKIKGGSVALN